MLVELKNMDFPPYFHLSPLAKSHHPEMAKCQGGAPPGQRLCPGGLFDAESYL